MKVIRRKNKIKRFIIFLFILGMSLHFILYYFTIYNLNRKIVDLIESQLKNKISTLTIPVENNEYNFFDLKKSSKQFPELEVLLTSYHTFYRNLYEVKIYRKLASHKLIYFYKTKGRNYQFYLVHFKHTFSFWYGKEKITLLIYTSYIYSIEKLFIFMSILTAVLMATYLTFSYNIRNMIKLKEQRQADYFLLQQLFEPFQKFHIQSRTVQIEYLVQQFSKFVYKERVFYLGGDCVYLKNIKLRDRNYLFFINADAMGKSLQGFGGIIVLNSVLSAILNRTEKRKIEKERFPDTWLKYASLEIHEVFKTFEGFMMISAIIGLLDEENGLVYFINFDHPKPILNSNHQYRLIESRIHKQLGFPQGNIFIDVDRIFLKQGDTLLIGSDGKDEIVIGNNINENENLSVQILEKSENDIFVFYHNIEKTGKIADDISILKIQFIKNPIYTFMDNSTGIAKPHIIIFRIKEKVKMLLKKRAYSEIIFTLRKIIEVFPVDDELLYIYCYACRKLNLFEEAIQIGERLLNFNKYHKRNYYNLIFCYYKLNNFTRIQSLLKEQEYFLPSSTKIKKFFSNL